MRCLLFPYSVKFKVGIGHMIFCWVDHTARAHSFHILFPRLLLSIHSPCPLTMVFLLRTLCVRKVILSHGISTSEGVLWIGSFESLLVFWLHDMLFYWWPFLLSPNTFFQYPHDLPNIKFYLEAPLWRHWVNDVDVVEVWSSSERFNLNGCLGQV